MIPFVTFIRDEYFFDVVLLEEQREELLGQIGDQGHLKHQMTPFVAIVERRTRTLIAIVRSDMPDIAEPIPSRTFTAPLPELTPV